MARILITEHHRHQVLALRGGDSRPRPLPDGGLSKPSGLALHPDGLLVVADSGNHRLAVLDLFASEWSYLGSGPGAGASQFDRPTAVACDGDGRIYVADAGNGRIVRVAADGSDWVAIGTAGRPDPSGQGPLLLADPRSLAVLPTGGIVVADPGSGSLIRIGATAFDDPAAASMWEFIALPSDAQPPRPFGLCPFADGLAVTDVGNRTVHVLAADGSPIAAFTPALQPLLAIPAYIAALDDNRLAVGDPSANNIRILRLTDGSLAEESVIRGSDPALPRHAFAELGGLTTGRLRST